MDNIKPTGIPISNPPMLHVTAVIKNESVMPQGEAPKLLRIAISFWRYITSIIIADEMLIEATRTISIIIKINKTFVEEKLSNSD